MRTLLGLVVTVLLGCAALVPAGLAAGTTTYRWVDAQGVVHYSDTPHPGAEQIQLSGAQTYHGTPVPATTQGAPAPPPAAAAGAAYQSCVITQPVPDTDLFAPEVVNISVRTIPALRQGDTLNVAVDGTPMPAVGDGQSFQIQQPERGSHTISAEVHAVDGSVVCSATPVTFSVQRPSVFSPAAPVKPH